jgi:NTE family protein
VIGGRPYVDAGFRQATSADLLAGLGLDEAYVLAPLAAAADEPRPTTRLGRLERGYRRHVTRVLAGEVGTMRRTGLHPSVIVPSAQARAVMGVNLMNPGRRHAVLAAVLGDNAVDVADASVAGAGEGS